jgi:hypothetical protein
VELEITGANPDALTEAAILQPLRRVRLHDGSLRLRARRPAKQERECGSG